MLTKRSQQKELIDHGPGFYTQKQYKICLRKLFRVNQFLGIFRDTKKILKKLTWSTLIDIGCGDGLFLLHINKYYSNKNYVGIDMNPDAVLYASENIKKHHAQENIAIYQESKIENIEMSCDVILATLVCHHMTDSELIVFLQQAYMTTKQMVIINDLVRSQIAYTLYAIFSPLLFRNWLITHDGLISIKRGFTRKEWILLLQEAGIKNYQIKWRWPFRWQVLLRK